MNTEEITQAIEKTLKNVHGFNHPINWISGEKPIGTISLHPKAEGRYMYAAVESSAKTSITGIVWDKETEAFTQVFSSQIKHGTRGPGNGVEFSHGLFTVQENRLIHTDPLTSVVMEAVIDQHPNPERLSLQWEKAGQHEREKISSSQPLSLHPFWLGKRKNK